LIRSIRKLDAHLPILVATGYGSEASMEELNALGIKGYLKKPFSARHILTHMVAALYETAH